MGQLTFQATLGGQVNLVGPNTASTYNINVPATSGNMVTTGDSATVTSGMLASTTGSGAVVLASSPTLVTPALGTPSALVGTNITGTAAGLSIGGNAVTATTATNVSGGTASVTTLTASSTTTLSGGTANGVAYLNGSKVVTTGSAFTFDGTNLGLGTTTPFADGGYRSIDIRGTTGGEVNLGTSSNNYGQILADATNGLLLNTIAATAPIKFYIGGSEQMRLTNTGLGIGTSSPNASAILDAQSTTKGVRMPNMTTTQKNAISSPAAGLIVFDTTLAKLCVYSGSAWQTITSV
jgi:hypothetical protein